MKNRYIIELSYLGKNFHGWQIQPNATTVQQYLQESVSTILREEVTITGAGRTDTGVHASYYVAHFDTETLLDTDAFGRKLNYFLSNDITIFSVHKSDPEFHARFNALSRSYKYICSLNKSPFLTDLCYSYQVSLDFEEMNTASALLLEYNDFTSFAKLHSDNKTNLCQIKEAKWELHGDCLIFTIKADRFLRNMVRAITGTIFDVGNGRIGLEEFKKIIEGRDNQLASASAPAKGLYLSDIEYDEKYACVNPGIKKDFPFL